MKKQNSKIVLGFLFSALIAPPGYASTDPNAKPVVQEVGAANSVTLEGKLACTFSRYTSGAVSFVSVINNSDGEKYSVNSPSDALKEQCQRPEVSSTTYRVEGQLTSKFLFWGGNLVVSSFKAKEAQLSQAGTN